MQKIEGTRLAFVVVPLEGTVKREIINCVTKNKDRQGRATLVDFQKKIVDEPAGFLVYFPRGHVLRFRSRDQLRLYGLDKEPHMISMRGLNDPNSPIGKLLRAQDDEARTNVMVNMEKHVIALATKKTGPITVEVTQ